MTSRTALIAVCCWLALAPAALADRTAEEIIKDYDAVSVAKYDSGKEDQPGYVKEFREASTRASERKGQFALELLNTEPGHERLPGMLIERWVQSMASPKTAANTVAELDRALPFFKNKAQIKIARQMKAIATIEKHLESPEAAMPEVERFLTDYPQDKLGANLLNGFSFSVKDLALKRTLLRRLIADFPEHPAAKGAKDTLEVLEKVGKPFALEFNEVIKNDRVSIKELKGKVVVLDVWATWCAPCVAEMPKMKALYDKYKDRGVEFIGISLDKPEEEGGLRHLKEFLTKNEILWPQCYDGKAWESPLVASLGVRAVPAVVLIDAEGNLAELDARGRLDALLADYLAKAKAAPRSR